MTDKDNEKRVSIFEGETIRKGPKFMTDKNQSLMDSLRGWWDND